MLLSVASIMPSSPALGQSAEAPVLVSRRVLVQSMTGQKALGYNLLATANGARLSSAVILDAARHAGERDATRSPILIDHRDYFEAYLEVTGIAREDAPTFMRIAMDHGEDQYIDYRQERVIEQIVRGTSPRLAVNVVADGPAVPKLRIATRTRTARRAPRSASRTSGSTAIGSSSTKT